MTTKDRRTKTDKTKQMYRFPENFTKEQIVKFYNTKIKYLNKELKKSKSNEFTKVILNKINEHYNLLCIASTLLFRH